MKVLVINGSPHENGDTKYIINRIKEKMPNDTEYEEINAYKSNIKPCHACNYCWKNEGCCISDKMDVILKDDYDVLVLASPVYMTFVTPPIFSIITRLNFIWNNKHFLNKQNNLKAKRGILVLVGGGDGKPDNAISISKIMFKFLNANFDINKDYIYSLNTNNIPASKDDNVEHLIEKVIKNVAD